MNIFIIIVWGLCLLGFLGIYYREKLSEYIGDWSLWTCAQIGLCVPLLVYPVCLLLWWYGVPEGAIIGVCFTSMLIGVFVTWCLGMITL